MRMGSGSLSEISDQRNWFQTCRPRCLAPRVKFLVGPGDFVLSGLCVPFSSSLGSLGVAQSLGGTPRDTVLKAGVIGCGPTGEEPHSDRTWKPEACWIGVPR